MLVYDKNASFSNVIRRQIKLDIDIVTYNNFGIDFDFNDKEEEYVLVLFVCSSSEDLFDFIKIYNKGVPVVVCAFKRDFLLEFSKIDDVLLLDGGLLKKELVQNIKRYLIDAMARGSR